MSTEIKKHPLAIAWDKWLASEEGQQCREVSTVNANHYLENRLHRAFMAGAQVVEPVVDAARKHNASWLNGHNYQATETRCPACRARRDFHKAVDEYERNLAE